MPFSAGEPLTSDELETCTGFTVAGGDRVMKAAAN